MRLEKIIKYTLVTTMLLFTFTACINASTHPILRNQADLMATEIRVNIYISDDIQSARINNFPLKAGSNYIKVPVGTHILYWSKKGVTHTKKIDVTRANDRFIIF